jgi:rhamnopyranosyl-N-acetylglucosaminyl-diphospho-decaprenol beta-1,3/1,4-galactofuranosyltransferase
MSQNCDGSKVAAVVVTFNRKLLLLECLGALLKQTHPVEQIYLIDNASTDGTPETLSDVGYLNHPKIQYVRLPNNSGGAGGFYEGIRHAHQGDFDWIWVMDDDAEPMPDALSILLSSRSPKGIKHYSALCGLKLGLDGLPQYAHRGRFEPSVGAVPLSELEAKSEQSISYASFVGLLIKAKAVEEIGYPLPEFFIWFDDVEYCQRLQRVGPIFYNPKSVILHKDGVSAAAENSKLIKYKKTPFSSQWKALCGFRNYLYVMRVHGQRDAFWCAKFLAKTLLKVLILEDRGPFLIKYYVSYWLQGMGLKPYKTISPQAWQLLR